MSVVLLAAGFLTYVIYLFCRKPSGMNGTEYNHIGWFVVDVFMIGGALSGLLLPARFEKLGGFCIVGLAFANLVMSAVGRTGSIFYVNSSNAQDKLILWLDFFIGIISLIATVCIVIALAFPKFSQIFGLVAVIALMISGILILVESIAAFTNTNYSWAYGINLIAVSLIIFGLGFGLVNYAPLLVSKSEAKSDFIRN